MTDFEHLLSRLFVVSRLLDFGVEPSASCATF